MKIKSKYFENSASGIFSQNLMTACHFLNISVKFWQHFIKILHRNRKIHQKKRMKNEISFSFRGKKWTVFR